MCPDVLTNALCNYYNVQKPELLKKKTKHRRAKRILNYILYNHFRSYTKVAAYLNYSDHTTTIKSISKVKKSIKNGSLVLKEIAEIYERINRM